jgi:hypothetical protein
MKLILEKPPAGFKKEAEYKPLTKGDMWINSDNCDVMGPCLNPPGFKDECRIVLARDVPEPKYVAWTIRQVPLNIWYRRKDKPTVICTIAGIDTTGSHAVLFPGHGWVYLDALLSRWECSNGPFGLTWQPCGMDKDIPF